MRADRLLSLLLLLQTRGQMSARALAAELEVSTRTIYRDVEALSMAGVPIYAETGAKEGYALLDSYRTSLTGLNEAEVRALFMLSIPQPLADLGVRSALRSALLKLTAALPQQQRQDEAYVRQRIHLDANWWFQGGESISHLPTVQQAVWQNRQLCIHYQAPYGPGVGVEQIVEPYGLVAKAGVWYVVYARNGRFQAQRVSKILHAQLLEEVFSRKEEFDLAVFWQGWCETLETQLPQYVVTTRMAPQLVEQLPYYFAEAALEHITVAETAKADGWRTVTLRFEYFDDARAKLLGLGGAVEVVAPLPLRLSIADYAAQIGKLYAET